MAITKNSQIDLNGNEMILDADADTKIDAATDDEIHFTVAGNETVYMGVTSYNASDRLVLTNVAGNASATIVAGTSGESSVFMADGTSGNASYRGYVQYQHTNDNMNIGTGGSERVRILGNNVFLTGGTDARIQLGTGGAGAAQVSNDTVHIRGDGTGMKLMAANGGNFLFEINGTEILQLGSSTILINGGNGQTFSDYVRTYSKSQSITFSSSTSSTSTTLSGYLTYQFMIDATLHFGYSGNGAISTHIKLSLCNTYSGLSVSTLHTAIGQSHNSYHTFTFSGTGAYNTRQLVVTCNPQGGQNASNTSGTIYYGMGV